MSTRKQRQSNKKKKKRDDRKRPSGDLPPRKKGDDATALKSMGIGVGIFLLLAIIFLMPIAGDTPFNHLLGLFKSDAPAAGAPADSDKKPSGKVKAKPSPTKIARSGNAGSAPPLDDVSDEEQGDLDDLIDKKSKKK